MARLTIKMNFGRDIWGEALIDDPFLPFCQHFEWSRWQDNVPPRTSILIPSARNPEKWQQTPVFLHRFVYLLNQLPEQDRWPLVNDPDNLLIKLKEIPRLKLRNPIAVLDCRLSNLDASLQPRSLAAYHRRRQKLVAERSALIQAKVISALPSDETTKEEIIEASEKYAQELNLREIETDEQMINLYGMNDTPEIISAFVRIRRLYELPLYDGWYDSLKSKGFPEDDITLALNGQIEAVSPKVKDFEQKYRSRLEVGSKPVVEEPKAGPSANQPSTEPAPPNRPLVEGGVKVQSDIYDEFDKNPPKTLSFD